MELKRAIFFMRSLGTKMKAEYLGNTTYAPEISRVCGAELGKYIGNSTIELITTRLKS